MISLKEQEKFIKSKGWGTYYDPKYWVHPKVVEDSKRQDYTNYGMDINSAYCFEKLDLPKFEFSIIPRISQLAQRLVSFEQIIKLLDTLEK